MGNPKEVHFIVSVEAISVSVVPPTVLIVTNFPNFPVCPDLHIKPPDLSIAVKLPKQHKTPEIRIYFNHGKVSCSTVLHAIMYTCLRGRHMLFLQEADEVR